MSTLPLAACHCCGLIQRSGEFPADVVCARCETPLADRSAVHDNQLSAALAATALILYGPAITLPFLRIERLGQAFEDSLIGGIRALFAEGHWFVGVVVLVFSVLLPLVKLAAILVLSLRHDWLHMRHRGITYRVVEQLGRWGMLDVLLVAVLVAFVKLGSLVSFGAGPGLATFAIFVLVSLLAGVLFNPHALWDPRQWLAMDEGSAASGPIGPAGRVEPPAPAATPDASPPPSAPLPAPRRREARGVWRRLTIWAIPVLALAAVTFLAARSWANRGRVIEIAFLEGHGLRPGDELKHLGIAVGSVESVELAPGGAEIRVQVRLAPAGSQLARRGSRFWIVRPQVDLTGISGLETLIGAKHLAVAPGPPDEPEESRFLGRESPPLIDAETPGGLRIVLQSSQAVGLRPGLPVWYRSLRVGSVASVTLAADGSAVESAVVIRPEFRQLVRARARFWNSSGLRIDGSLTSVRVHVAPAEAWLRGGIEFAVPDDPGPEVTSGHRFRLAERAEPEWLNWSPALTASDLSLGRDLPPLERAVVLWDASTLFRTRTGERSGLVLPLESGFLAPRAFVDPPHETARLTLADQTIPLAGDVRTPFNEQLAIVAAAPTRAARIRSPDRPEDGFLVVGEATPVFIAAARMSEEAGLWSIDRSLPVADPLPGAAFVAASDHAVIAMLIADGESWRLAPLRRTSSDR
ncbi:MAG: paraquat-inducible protein A [Planctomyces sp.]|nr:paraquat-inducible protein A [Planctomyces sp.]